MNRILLAIMAAILTLSVTTLADVKIKTKQTTSGQTSENTTYIKGKRQRNEMMGGISISITQCDLSRDLQLNPSTKTYMVSSYDTTNEAVGVTAKTGSVEPATKGGTMYVTTTVRDTGERKQMFGFTARHIVQTIETETTPDACVPSKTKMEMDMWVIDAEFGLACTQSRQYRPTYNARNGGCQDKVVPKTVGNARSGYPLWQKMTAFDASGKETFTTVQEVVELSRSALDPSLFDVPADFREVKDMSQMYAMSSNSSTTLNMGENSAASSSSGPTSGMAASLRNASANRNEPVQIGAKQAGTVRIGLAGIKVTAVGEGIAATDLSTAIQNSLGEYLKGTRVEVVPLEAKLGSAQAAEAKAKECDFIVLATVSHKKGGGGGFGFGKMLAQTIGQTGIGHTGSVAGNIAGQMATTVIVSAGQLSSNVKSKDEITLDLRIQDTNGQSTALSKQFKLKAKSDGEDIISPLVEQVAQAIVDTIGK